MRTFKKIILGVCILIFLVAIVAYAYLFLDNPYPEIQRDGLTLMYACIPNIGIARNG